MKNEKTVNKTKLVHEGSSSDIDINDNLTNDFDPDTIFTPTGNDDLFLSSRFFGNNFMPQIEPLIDHCKAEETEEQKNNITLSAILIVDSKDVYETIPSKYESLHCQSLIERIKENKQPWNLNLVSISIDFITKVAQKSFQNVDIYDFITIAKELIQLPNPSDPLGFVAFKNALSIIENSPRIWGYELLNLTNRFHPVDENKTNIMNF
ncbi:MAG: hypothetical protein K2Q14_02235 [Gammaproteobacteria bacterium]|nr:hypothetical protein [Gammaproteobacteria bacterium]